MAERPTTIRLAPEIEAAVRAFATETGITFNAALKVLISEALDARGRHPNKQRPAEPGTDRRRWGTSRADAATED